MDGRYSEEDIRKSMATDEGWEATRQRLKNIDVLIIDECSMISTRIFNQVSTDYGKKKKK